MACRTLKQKAPTSEIRRWVAGEGRQREKGAWWGWWWLWTTDGWSGGTGCLGRSQTAHGGDILALNGAQLHAVSGIMALNRSQLHMGYSDDSCTLSTLIEITGRGWERRGEVVSRQKEEKRGQEEERKSERVRMPPLFICNTFVTTCFSKYFTETCFTWSPIRYQYTRIYGGQVQQGHSNVITAICCFGFPCIYDSSSHYQLVFTHSGFLRVTTCCLPTFQIIVMITAAENVTLTF